MNEPTPAATVSTELPAGPPLVIGLDRGGGDEAAALVAVHELERACGPDVRVSESTGEPARLRRLLAESDTVVLVGSVRTGAAPGTVRRIDVDPSDLSSAPLGEAALAPLVERAAADGRLPAHLVLYVIEGRHFGRRAGISPEAVRGAAAVADRVRSELLDPTGPDGGARAGRSALPAGVGG